MGIQNNSSTIADHTARIYVRSGRYRMFTLSLFCWVVAIWCLSTELSATDCTQQCGGPGKYYKDDSSDAASGSDSSSTTTTTTPSSSTGADSSSDTSSSDTSSSSSDSDAPAPGAPAGGYADNDSISGHTESNSEDDNDDDNGRRDPPPPGIVLGGSSTSDSSSTNNGRPPATPGGSGNDDDNTDDSADNNNNNNNNNNDYDDDADNADTDDDNADDDSGDDNADDDSDSNGDDNTNSDTTDPMPDQEDSDPLAPSHPHGNEHFSDAIYDDLDAFIESDYVNESDVHASVCDTVMSCSAEVKHGGYHLDQLAFDEELFGVEFSQAHFGMEITENCGRGKARCTPFGQEGCLAVSLMSQIFRSVNALHSIGIHVPEPTVAHLKFAIHKMRTTSVKNPYGRGLVGVVGEDANVNSYHEMAQIGMEVIGELCGSACDQVTVHPTVIRGAENIARHGPITSGTVIHTQRKSTGTFHAFTTSGRNAVSADGKFLDRSKSIDPLYSKLHITAANPLGIMEINSDRRARSIYQLELEHTAANGSDSKLLLDLLSALWRHVTHAVAHMLRTSPSALAVRAVMHIYAAFTMQPSIIAIQ